MDIGHLSIVEAARQAAGNWRKFESFSWDGYYDLDNPDDWTIVYTHNRDSRLIEESNADAIARELKPFFDADEPDIISESHNHWACGWIGGYSIRVYRNGEITQAFREFHRLAAKLADYPILDEEDYSRREYNATIHNIEHEARGIVDDWELPESWPNQVFTWLWDNDQSALENRDDQGGYPSREQIQNAFRGLGFSLLDCKGGG